MAAGAAGEEEPGGKGKRKYKRVGQYAIGRTIGEGTYGSVKFARDLETREGVAVKVLRRKQVERANRGGSVKREITIMKAVRHPCIVDLKGVLATKSRIYIVMELVTGGELFDLVAARGPLPEDECRQHFNRLIDGVEFCHRKGVCHRDLKPENLLLDQDGRVKISDFGLSSLTSRDLESGNDPHLTTTCGTPNYVAPEVLRHTAYDGRAADVWSCGIILYVLVAGWLPFDEPTLPELYSKISRADYAIPSNASTGMANLLSKILVPDPKRRASIGAIKADPWFRLHYTPVKPHVDAIQRESVEDGINHIEEVSAVGEDDQPREPKATSSLNAFELINMSAFDLGNLFEAREDIVHRHTRFATSAHPEETLRRIQSAVAARGLSPRRTAHSLHMEGSPERFGYVSAMAELFEILPGLFFAEFRRVRGDPRHFYKLFLEVQGDLSDIIVRR